MMYNTKMVAAVKVGGKVLREVNDNVFIPFGSQYSILLKNLNTKRVSVAVEIDGENISDQGDFVIMPNGEFELERFLKGSLKEGNKFKFIERNAAVEKARGIKLEDGIIRISFQFERVNVWEEKHFVKPTPSPWPWPPHYSLTSSLRSDLYDGHIVGASVNYAQTEQNNAGITVAGERSDQSFTTVSSFPLDGEQHVMVLKLLGETAAGLVEKPVLTVSKQKCPTCGKVNKATSKFCTECGTSLTLWVGKNL